LSSLNRNALQTRGSGVWGKRPTRKDSRGSGVYFLKLAL